MPYLCADVKDGLTLTDTHCLKMCDLQNTAEMHLVSTDLKNSNKRFSTFNFHDIPSCVYMEFLPFFLFFLWLFTCTCLQSCPRAGSWIRRNVMGHLSDTLMAVCSTPSSPFSVVFPEDAATLLKFLFTARRGWGNQQAEEERNNRSALQRFLSQVWVFLNRTQSRVPKTHFGLV